MKKKKKKKGGPLLSLDKAKLIIFDDMRVCVYYTPSGWNLDSGPVPENSARTSLSFLDESAPKKGNEKQI
jgi:hypothetical protein